MPDLIRQLEALPRLTDDPGPSPSTLRARARRRQARRRAVGASVAAVVLVAGVAGALAWRGGASSTDTVRTDSAPSSGQGDARLAVHASPPVGAQQIAEVVSTGRSLVGDTFVWATDPLQWSSDGVRWEVSQVPSSDREAWSKTSLDAVGPLAVWTGAHHTAGLDSEPFIWVSRDGGRTFHQGADVATGLRSGEVVAVEAVGDSLVALGRGTTVEGVNGAMRWQSSDGGRTWDRTAVQGAGRAFTTSDRWVAADGATMLTVETVAEVVAGRHTSRTQLLRSTDAGQTWSPVPYDFEAGLDRQPDPGFYDALRGVSAVDGRFTVGTLQRRWISSDGLSWTLLGTAPAIADDEGTLPDPTESGAVGVFEVDGDRLLATVHSFYNNDHDLGHLAWSDDAGATWHASELGVSCTGGQDVTSTIATPSRLGPLLVTTWTCQGLGDRGGHLLVSSDDGHTWAPRSVAGVHVNDLLPLRRLGGDRLVTLGADNVERGVDVTLRMGLTN